MYLCTTVPSILSRAWPADDKNTLLPAHSQTKHQGYIPQSKHWHLINYVITRRDLQDVRVIKALCGAECWTDHRFIIIKLNVHIQPQGKRVPKSLNISKPSPCNLFLSDTCYMKTSSKSSPSSTCPKQMLTQIGMP